MPDKKPWIKNLAAECADYVDLVSKITEVEAVFASTSQPYFCLWTVMNKIDNDAERKVYDSDFTLLDKYPTAKIDFHITERRNRLLEEILPHGFQTIYRAAKE
jgi:hypothetical protein